MEGKFYLINFLVFNFYENLLENLDLCAENYRKFSENGEYFDSNLESK